MSWQDAVHVVAAGCFGACLLYMFGCLFYLAVQIELQIQRLNKEMEPR